MATKRESNVKRTAASSTAITPPASPRAKDRAARLDSCATCGMSRADHEIAAVNRTVRHPFTPTTTIQRKG